MSCRQSLTVFTMAEYETEFGDGLAATTTTVAASSVVGCIDWWVRRTGRTSAVMTGQVQHPIVADSSRFG